MNSSLKVTNKQVTVTYGVSGAQQSWNIGGDHKLTISERIIHDSNISSKTSHKGFEYWLPIKVYSAVILAVLLHNVVLMRKHVCKIS